MKDRVAMDTNIKRLRDQLELSQERFAQLLGVSLQTVRRWEAGVSKPLPIIGLKIMELERKTSAARVRGETAGISAGKHESPKRAAPAGQAEMGMGGLFRGIGGLLDLVNRMAEEGKAEEARFGEMESLGGKAKAVYGISVKLGMGGKPVIEQFGNVRATETGAEVAEAREPLVDVLDEGDHMVVLAELPGVEDDDIHLEINGDILSLTAEGKYRKYHREVLLPAPAEAAPSERSYRNGIIELRLAKAR